MAGCVNCLVTRNLLFGDRNDPAVLDANIANAIKIRFRVHDTAIDDHDVIRLLCVSIATPSDATGEQNGRDYCGPEQETISLWQH